MTEHHGLGPTRARVLSLLQVSPGAQTINQIAEKLGLHKNSARFHLDALADAGYAERRKDSTGAQGRPPMLYTATPDAPTLSNLHLVELTEILIKNFVGPVPDAAQRAYDAGVECGGSIEPPPSPEPDDVVRSLGVHMGQRGFAMEPDGDSLIFGRCPFRDIVADEQLPYICAMHQGMVEAYADGTQVEVGRFEVGARTCRLPITRPEHAVAS